MALKPTQLNQGSTPISDLQVQSNSSFKPVKFPMPLHGALANAGTVISSEPYQFLADDSASYIVDAVVGAAAQTQGREQVNPLISTFPAVKIKQITLSCIAAFGTAKIATVVVSKVSGGVATALNETAGTPAANIVGEGASAGLTLDTANSIVVLPLKDTLTDAELTILPGDYFTVVYSSVTTTPGATGLTATVTGVAESLVDQPAGVA